MRENFTRFCFTGLLAFVFLTFGAEELSAESLTEAFVSFEELKPWPDIDLFDAEGKAKKFPPGRVLVVNFWASWCAPCVIEMPALDRLAKDMVSQGVDVILVSEDRNLSSALKSFQRLEITNIPFLIDREGQMAKALDIFSLPATFIIDREGRLRARLSGPAEWTKEEMNQALRAILN